MAKNKKIYKKIALLLSLCLIVVWALLGTGASLAWFSDKSPELNNIFHIADFDLEVSHRLDNGEYEEITAETKIFDEQALYEPGYVQVVYLKIENKGALPFNFKTAINVTNYTPAKNVFGGIFNLQDYLKFGIVYAQSENELDDKLENRQLAKELATMELNNYSTDACKLQANHTMYAAIVLRMPEEINNVANYRGLDIPTVELGIIVNASQIS